MKRLALALTAVAILIGATAAPADGAARKPRPRPVTITATATYDDCADWSYCLDVTITSTTDRAVNLSADSDYGYQLIEEDVPLTANVPTVLHEPFGGYSLCVALIVTPAGQRDGDELAQTTACPPWMQ